MTPPVLLTMADYYGTLAAVRCLGRRQVPVTMAEWRWLAPARWSRFVTRSVRCPDLAQTDQFLEWLVDFGERHPGHVLYPTSDDLCWLFAANHRVLEKRFRLYQPGLEPTYTLLNKRKLHQACAAVGLSVPRTWLPTSEAEVERVAAEAEFPVLVKPQTQILFPSHTKGMVVKQRGQLVERYLAFAQRHRHGEALAAQDPAVRWPMVQAFHPEARRSIYSLGGLIDTTGELFAALASRKVLQRPRRLGIGLCFEAAAVEPELAKRLAALCTHLGYHGVFEVELIETDQGPLLIDFNPRFYSQMAVDIDRGLALPWLVYQAACGQTDELRQWVARAAEGPADAQRVYTHRHLLALMLSVQRLAGRLTVGEAQSLRQRFLEPGSSTTDAVADRDDRLPELIDIALHLTHYSRHPRAFVRSMVLDA
jgi:predicted ATP-grasp superfamily ATP-dependent carboligase